MYTTGLLSNAYRVRHGRKVRIHKEEPSSMKRGSLRVHFRQPFLRVARMQLHKSSSQQDQHVANSVASPRNTPESKIIH
jgi:hypothetical protein